MYPPEKQHTHSNQRVGQQSANGHHVNQRFEVKQESHDGYSKQEKNTINTNTFTIKRTFIRNRIMSDYWSNHFHKINENIDLHPHTKVQQWYSCNYNWKTSCFFLDASSSKPTCTWTNANQISCRHVFTIKRAECFPGLTAVIISTPSVVWCEIHCGVPSLVSQHQTPGWSWSQQHSSNTERWYVRCPSQHYFITPLSRSTSRSVHGLCSGSGGVGVLGPSQRSHPGAHFYITAASWEVKPP